MPESKKVVIKLDIHDDDCKRKALKAVSGLSGIESLAIDMKDQKLTIIGDVDPVDVAGKLKKWHGEIFTVGPAKEEKKVGGDKEAEEKKRKEEEDKKKKEKEKEEEEERRRWLACRGYNHHYYPYQNQRYCLHPVEEGPNGCVIS